MKNVTITDIYRKLEIIERKMDMIEAMMIKEEKLSPSEIKKIKRRGALALKEHYEGKTVNWRVL